MRRTATVALALLVSLGSVAACGDDDDAESSAGDETNVTQLTTADTTAETAAVDTTGGKTKPEVTVPETAPTELVVTDIEVGTGATAEKGKKLEMHYVGVAFSTKEQFDSSWDAPGGPKPLPFILQNEPRPQVIAGWDQGLVGMKVGGRRQLVIPPDLAYGAEGFPPVIAPNETLVFVVDLVSVT